MANLFLFTFYSKCNRLYTLVIKMKSEIENAFIFEICKYGKVKITSNFLKDLFDLNLKKVFPLDEKETLVLRMIYGFCNQKYTTSQISKEMKISRSRINQIKKEAERLLRLYFKKLNVSNLNNQELQLKDLDLSTPVLRALFYNEIRTIKELLNLKEEDILNLRKIGPTYSKELIEKVKSNNLSFRNKI